MFLGTTGEDLEHLIEKRIDMKKYLGKKARENMR